MTYLFIIDLQKSTMAEWLELLPQRKSIGVFPLAGCEWNSQQWVSLCAFSNVPLGINRDCKEPSLRPKGEVGNATAHDNR